MTVLAALVLGALGGLGAHRLLASTLRTPVLERTNYRGATLSTAAGLSAILAVVLIEATAVLVESARPSAFAARLAGGPVLTIAVGFGLLGLIDDILGAGESGGFRGHLKALLRGRLTSGGVKLFGGAALAVVVVGRFEPGDTGRILADAALVALAANLANLMDRAPGRCLKVAAISFALLAGFTLVDPSLAGVGLVVGACLVLLVDDLAERVMIGDVGANVVGAVLGLGAWRRLGSVIEPFLTNLTVTPSDPLLLVVTGGVLLATALVAGLVPALRARAGR